MSWLRGVAVLLLAVTPGCFTPTTAEDPLPGPQLWSGVVARADSTTGELQVVASTLIEASPVEIAPWFHEPEKVQLWLAERAESASGPDNMFHLAWPSYGVEMRGRRVAGESLRSMEIRLEPFGELQESVLLVSAEREAPGYSRVRIQQWPFPGGPEGEAIAEAHRQAWFQSLLVLRSAMERRLPTTPAAPPLHPPAPPAVPPAAGE